MNTDTSNVPTVARYFGYDEARSLYRKAEHFFSIPKNAEAFEKWKEERRKTLHQGGPHDEL